MPSSFAGKQIRRLSIHLPAQKREMFRQQIVGLLHAMDDARGEFRYHTVASP